MRWPKLWMVSGKFFPTHIHKVEISAKPFDTYLTLVIGGNCKPGNVLSRPRLGPLGFALGRRPRSPIPEAAPWVTLAPTIVMAKREYKSWLHSFQTRGFWQKPMAQMWPWNIWNETCNFLKLKKNHPTGEVLHIEVKKIRWPKHNLLSAMNQISLHKGTATTMPRNWCSPYLEKHQHCWTFTSTSLVLPKLLFICWITTNHPSKAPLGLVPAKCRIGSLNHV